MRHHTRWRTGFTCALVLGSALVAIPHAAVQAAPTCAGPAPGGEWRTYGQDLHNTRSQEAEDVIDPAAAANLRVDWNITVSDLGGTGNVESTPIVADGCVIFGTTSGWLFALNADTGEVVWKEKHAVSRPGLLCAGIVGSTSVDDEGRAFAIVSQAGDGVGHGPYIVAHDQATGALLWGGADTHSLDHTEGVYNCAGPVPFHGMVLAAFNGDQTAAMNRGGFVIYDAATGAELVKTYTIPDEDIDDSKGGGVWSTAAVDQVTGYAYMGTSNPDAGTTQHAHADAILKVDVARARDSGGNPVASTEITNPSFGQIVGSYSGTPDRYLPLPDPPTCNPDPSIDVYVRQVLCLQMDLDFGASPQLFDGPEGQRYVGELQKSGVYHVADTTDMEGVWETVVAPPTFYSSASTAATDGSSIFVVGSPPGQMFSLDALDGLYEWASPIADVLHYEGVAHANGLVYTTDAKGFLDIYHATTGAIVAHRPIHLDVGTFLAPSNASSASLSIARHTVFAAWGEHLVAYVPPTTA